MKFQYKALVAALALSAAAVPAQAGVQKAVLNGDSSMVLTLLDFSSNVSAMFDLGYTYSQFNQLVVDAHTNGTLNAGGLTKSLSFDLTSGDYADAWNTFSGLVNPANVKWAVYAADGQGTGVGAQGDITTYKSGANLTATTQLTTAIANFNGYVNNAGFTGNHLTVADGAGVTTSNTSLAFAGRATAYGSTGRVNAAGHVSMNTLDTSMTVVQRLTGANAGQPVSFSTLGQNNKNFLFTMSSTGTLDFVVPVPEADSYAMLLAGLGVAGLVARRRQA